MGADDVGEGSNVGTGIAVGEKGTEAASADFLGRLRFTGWSRTGVADLCRSRLMGWSRFGVADRFLFVPLELLLVLR